MMFVGTAICKSVIRLNVFFPIEATVERMRRLFQDSSSSSSSSSSADGLSEKCPTQIPVIIVGNKYDEFQARIVRREWI